MITKKIMAEFFGTALFLAIIVGSGIMGSALAAGNDAVALLANSIVTGAGLYVLISLLGPISGGHFNPAVSLVCWRNGNIDLKQLFGYWICQFFGGIIGVFLTHIMFEFPIYEFSTKPRSGIGQWVSEFVGTLILLSVIKIGIRVQKEGVPAFVALTVVGGYWFTSSTFFCNPAVTVARSLTSTFAGIQPRDAISFLIVQLLAAGVFIVISKRSLD